MERPRGKTGARMSEADLPESNARLVEEIRAEIERSGRIPFSRFMELALYEPEHGYYATDDGRPTRGGDFLTAPETHSIFGRAIARQLDDLWQGLGSPSPFIVVEYGAGTGTLALDMLQGLAAERSGLVSAIRYRPVEISDGRERTIRTRLTAAGFGEQASDDSNGRFGCVIANEFLDALPVHRVVQASGRLHELLVGWRGGAFVEVRGEPSTPALAQRLSDEGLELGEGQQAEICLGLDRWASDLATRLDRGFALVVDYGYPADQLYREARRSGTLRAYTQHRAHADPFVAIGRQDLTAHVDFTAVEQALEKVGWRMIASTTQAEFLVGVGVEDILRSIQNDPATTAAEYLRLRSSLVRMLDPRAMGGFGVLLFGRGVPASFAPRGFAYRIRPGA
jgi:SAM-dependent MidA family methyltransferase